MSNTSGDIEGASACVTHTNIGAMEHDGVLGSIASSAT